jgi:DNA-binding IclR family transcriptional regulator
VTAVRVLDVLATCQGSASLDELTKALGEPRSSVHRILNTLVESDLLQRPRLRGGYRIGPKAMTWGSAFLNSVNLVDEFRAVAEPAVARINETMQLAVLDLPDVVFVAHVDSNRAVRLATAVGRRLPAHATAAGKVLLAFVEGPLADAYGERPLAQLTPRTVTSLEELDRHLARARRRGWAEASEESSANLTCLAAPVRSYDGMVVAAMTICVPEPALKLSDRRVLGHELVERSNELSRQIGWGASYGLGEVAGEAGA